MICKSDPSQSYALYIPEQGSRRALPIVYFFDPHADGALPLRKYKSLADVYGFILAGSNTSRNGNDWPTTANIWSHLFDDTRDRWKINTGRIYTAGFSGGAKVAGYIALNYPGVKGVIANGAGLPDGTPAGNFDFSFTAIAGEGDMNMTDLVAISHELDNSRTRHRILFFDGKHEWAPVGIMNTAFAGLEFDAMRQGLLPRDQGFTDRYIAKSKKTTDALILSGQLIKAGQECRITISFLDGLSDGTQWFRDKAASLAKNTRYQQQIQVQSNLLTKEQDIKSGYMLHFRQDDQGYWTRTIHELQLKAGTRTAERSMYQRLLAYLSLAFYSFSNHLINSNKNNQASYFVELYKMADASNSEAWYFSAILHARDRQAQAAERDLLNAVRNGFGDKGRMRAQPEFSKLFSRGELFRIEEAMHD